MHFCGIRMTTQSDAANFFCARVWRGSALTRGGGRRGGGRRGCFAREQKQSFCTGQLRADAWVLRSASALRVRGVADASGTADAGASR
jgi:hypothetical protein